MKSHEFLPESELRKEQRKVDEMASCGATGAGAVATNVGGAAGFGKSIFMRRTEKPKKKK